jgi:Transposase, Mutator family
MADRPRMTAAQLANKLLVDEHADVLRESAAWMAAELMEAEVATQIGAELGQRTPDRVAHRNGYRPRAWDTRVGELELAIPGCAKARTSRRFWSHGGAPSRRWSRWCRRPTSTGSAPGGWTGWSSSSAWRG